MRASDSERKRTIARLSAGYADGRLGTETFAHRVDLAYRAGSRKDLHALTADLAGRVRQALEDPGGIVRSLLGQPNHIDPPCVWLTPPDATGGPWIIGRSPECDLLIDDETVSRRHAELRWTPQGYTVRDLDSTNGCRVNNTRVSVALLRPGDELLLAEVRVRLAQRP